MAVRTALLTSRNINLDTDFSKYIESVSTAGVITGFQVTASAVATGQARVPCVRTNLETIYAFVQNYNSISISGDGYVIISIPQNIVDNGGGNEDGTGIATVEVVDTLPTKNYLLLATISSGTVTDNRVMIPKVGELKTDIDTIFAQIADLDERVDKLENAAAIDHLEERALVGEKYALTDTLFKQITPALADCTVEANVGDTAANTEIHIQRQGSGTASNKLKIKVKKTGSPVDLIVEVRKGIEVDVSQSEAYWYGDSSNVIAIGSITASTITTSWQELEITLDAEFGGTEGELLDIVLYQNNSTVNASNYYVIACDSTQWSEGFSYVSVNGTTRTRQKLMPYCVSSGFAQAMLSKVSDETVSKSFSVSFQSANQTLATQTFSSGSSGTKSRIFDDIVAEIPSEFPSGTLSINVPYTMREYTCAIGTAKNGTFQNDGINGTSNGTKTFTFSKSTTGGDAWRMYGNITDSTHNAFVSRSNYITATYTGTFILHKNNNNKVSLPRQLKDIGGKATATLFGMHIDNTRYTGEYE